MTARTETLAFLCLALAGCADASCKPPKEVSEIPLLRFAGHETVPVEINGQPAGMWLDTGASGTTITPQAVADLGLKGSRTFLKTEGVGGEASNSAVEIASLKVGNAEVSDAVALEVPLSDEPLDKLPTYGLLGQDIMTHWDLDLDAAHDQLTLYQPQHCGAPAAPWRGGDAATPLQSDYTGLDVAFPVTLDGHTLSAVLDTGASRSFVRRSATGLDPTALADDPSGHGIGINLLRVNVRLHRFDHLQIAGTEYGPIALAVGDFQFGDYDLLLGEDFLRHHRVYIAFQAHELLIGPVSP